MGHGLHASSMPVFQNGRLHMHEADKSYTSVISGVLEIVMVY